MTYLADPDRYESATSGAAFRRCGRSGLELPAISLGLWHNFGDDRPLETQRAILRRAFDRGVTHFDLANNYGPPYGSAESNFGTIFAKDFRPYRDELILSTKAGYDMWPGPYGQGGGSRKYLLASLDQSLPRMGVDYVDIFYSHRFDPDTPLEETMGALDAAVRAGKALYVGHLVVLGGSAPGEAVDDPARAGHAAADPPAVLLDAQPVDRGGPARRAGGVGVGCIAFSPLAQGMLTDKYLDGIPEGSRAARDASLSPDLLTEQTLAHVRALNAMAVGAGPVAGADGAGLGAARRAGDVGADRREQRRAARRQPRRPRGPPFTADELDQIDKHAVDAGINLWARSSSS